MNHKPQIPANHRYKRYLTVLYKEHEKQIAYNVVISIVYSLMFILFIVLGLINFLLGKQTVSLVNIYTVYLILADVTLVTLYHYGLVRKFTSTSNKNNLTVTFT